MQDITHSPRNTTKNSNHQQVPSAAAEDFVNQIESIQRENYKNLP